MRDLLRGTILGIGVAALAAYGCVPLDEADASDGSGTGGGNTGGAVGPSGGASGGTGGAAGSANGGSVGPSGDASCLAPALGQWWKNEDNCPEVGDFCAITFFGYDAGGGFVAKVLTSAQSTCWQGHWEASCRADGVAEVRETGCDGEQATFEMFIDGQGRLVIGEGTVYEPYGTLQQALDEGLGCDNGFEACAGL